MVATLFELNHGLAPVTALPSFSLGLLEELIGILISGTAPAGMPSATARTTHFGLAAAAFGIIAPILTFADVLGLDPLTTPWRGAVDSIPSRIFCKLFVPRLLKGVVKQAFDMLQWDILCAAFRGHGLRVLDRELEAPFQTRVTHPVSAFELRRLLNRYFIVHADDARNAIEHVRMTNKRHIGFATNTLSGVSGAGGWRETPKKLLPTKVERLPEDVML